MTPNLVDLAPDTLAVRRAVEQIHSLHCITAACRSVVRFDHVMTIMADGEETTMGVTYYRHPNQRQAEERRLHATLLDHPNRFGPMCALLTGLASRYARPGARQGVDYELFVGVAIVDLALRMDGFGPPHCLPAVLAAMPRTAEADTAIGNEKLVCDAARVSRTPCARIARPPAP